MGEQYSGQQERERVRSPEIVVAELTDHFERVGHRLGREGFDKLIDDVATADLSTDPLAQKLGRTPLAKIDCRVITLDRRFELLSPEKQRHVLMHEYSHALDWRLGSQVDNERYQHVAGRVHNLPGSHVSSYISRLEAAPNDRSPEELERFLAEERMAETFAQYLESDRTFTGFVLAKLASFEAPSETDHDEAYTEIAAKVGSLADYIDLADNEAEQSDFFAHHPGLQQEYELWQNLTELFDDIDLDTDDQTAAEMFDEDLWDDDDLVAAHHPEEVAPARTPRTIFGSREQPAPAAGGSLTDLINFWRLFSTTGESESKIQ